MSHGLRPFALLACSSLAACSAFGAGTAPSSDEGEPVRVEPAAGVDEHEAPNAGDKTTGESDRTITFVQKTSGTFGETSSAAVELPSPSAAGDLIVLAIGWFDTSAKVTSVTDSAGNVYRPVSKETTLNISSRALTQQIFFAAGTKAAAQKITIRWDQTAVNPDIRVAEFAGLDLAQPLEQSIVTTSAPNALSVTSGAVTITHGPSLLFAGVTTEGLAVSGDPRSQEIISEEKNLAHWMVVGGAGTHSLTAAQETDDDDGPGVEAITEIVAFR
jgi:hypothetical protein